MSHINQYKAFVYAYRSQSISEAAQALNLTPSAVSKQIALLEQRLGVRLFERTHRYTRPTAQGRAFFNDCLSILDQVEQAEANLRLGTETVKGNLRITLSQSLVGSPVFDCLATFAQTFEHIRLHLTVTEDVQGFEDHELDFAFRIGELGESSKLIALPLLPVRPVFYVHNDYIERYGLPKRFAQLTSHKLVMPPMQQLSGVVRDTLKTVGVKLDQREQHITDDLGALHALVKTGHFIGFGLDYSLQWLITKGPFTVLQLDVKLPEKLLYLVYRQSPNTSASANAFKEHIRRHLVT